MAHLEVFTPGQSGQPITLGKTLSLGRNPENDVMLADSRVSRQHARITRQGEDFHVEDLSSSNGTFLQDQRLSPGVISKLADGDEIRLGSTRLVFRLYRFISSSDEIPRPSLWSPNPPQSTSSSSALSPSPPAPEQKKSSLSDLLNTPVPMPGFLRQKESASARVSR